MARAGAVIELRNVGKSFGATRAIDDVSLSIARGEFVVLIGASGFYVLYLAGLSWKVMVGLAAAAAAAAPLAWQQLHDYQRERILTFLDPTRDPLTSTSCPSATPTSSSPSSARSSG